MPIPAPVVAAAKGLIAKGISAIGFGGFGKPRGDLKKFSRTVYPFMVAQANGTKRSVYSFWFGEVIEVNPDGTKNVVARPGVISGAEPVYRQKAEEKGTIYIMEAFGVVDVENIVELSAKASFRVMHGQSIEGVIDVIDDTFFPDNDRIISDQPSVSMAGFDTLSLIVIGGVVVTVLLSKKRR